MSRALFILNDAPFGTERTYNGLRLAGALSKREGEEIRMFLIGDAASSAAHGLDAVGRARARVLTMGVDSASNEAALASIANRNDTRGRSQGCSGRRCRIWMVGPPSEWS